MFYIYILLSLMNGDIYVGSCEDLQIRLKRHNEGKVRSTKSTKPWKLMAFEIYPTRGDAFRREMFLKTGQQKERLRKLYATTIT